MRADLKGHETVTHAHDEYVNERGDTTNQVEGYFGQLKRSIDGTHQQISREHLQRYLAQFDFMYTNCKLSDSQRMRTMIGQVGVRWLTYKQPRQSDAG